MVRLVFRPYTQIRRTICTSVSLRASTRVSPGFTLFRHRSPSFGSQQICSYSNLPQATDRSIVPHCRANDNDSYLSCKRGSLHFHYAFEFSTQILAYMSDSLVRVSRRVNENHVVRISSAAVDWPNWRHALRSAQLCCPRPRTHLNPAATGSALALGSLGPIHGKTSELNRRWAETRGPTFSLALSHESNRF